MGTSILPCQMIKGASEIVDDVSDTETNVLQGSAVIGKLPDSDHVITRGLIKISLQDRPIFAIRSELVDIHLKVFALLNRATKFRPCRT